MKRYETIDELIKDRLWVPGKGISSLDSASNYVGEYHDEWVIGLSITRDSDCLERSNYRVLLKEINDDDNDDSLVKINYLNHWACGTIDQILIHKSATDKLKVLMDCLNALSNYPVLDEDDHSELEMEEANEVWANCYNSQERISYIKENRSQFEFRNLADMLGCVRGKYFAGYASELLL